MGTETLIAHCGACAGLMVLIQTADAWWYACTNPACGEETDPRPTAAAAAEDVVWVPAQQSRPVEANMRKHSAQKQVGRPTL